MGSRNTLNSYFPLFHSHDRVSHFHGSRNSQQTITFCLPHSTTFIYYLLYFEDFELNKNISNNIYVTTKHTCKLFSIFWYNIPYNMILYLETNLSNMSHW